MLKDTVYTVPSKLNVGGSVRYVLIRPEAHKNFNSSTALDLTSSLQVLNEEGGANSLYCIIVSFRSS